MSIPLVGQVGPQTLGDGSLVPPRLGREGAMIVQNLHGRYYEQVMRGNVFMAANQAAAAVTVGLATTYTGLSLSNPLNSGKNLVLLSVGVAITVAPAAPASIHLIGAPTQISTHTTPVTPRNALLGNASTPTGLVDAAATIPTPFYLMSLMGGFTAGALPSSPNCLFDIDGQLVLAPGSFVAIGALTALTGMIGSFVWEEVNL